MTSASQVHMTRPGGQDEPSLEREMRTMLRVLAAEGCLEVLRELATGRTVEEEIARATGIPFGEVTSHVRRLANAGVGPAGYAAAYKSISRLVRTPALATPAHDPPVGSASGEEPAVPDPPHACTVCEQSGFVAGVLGDLRTASRRVRDYHRRIQEMSSQVLTAHEAERLRIARELHDDTAQAITSMLVRLRLLERSGNSEEVLNNLEDLRELTAGALDSVRRLAMDLRPAALDDLGLAPALQSFAERHAADWGIEIPVTVRGIRRRLPRDVELVLYRVLQEALTNVAKHAEASRAKVTLSRKSNTVTLVVEDDGKGLDQRKSLDRQSGLGLFGMQERLALVGGDLEVKSEKGKGTTITARVPLPRGRRTSRRRSDG